METLEDQINRKAEEIIAGLKNKIISYKGHEGLRRTANVASVAGDALAGINLYRGIERGDNLLITGSLLYLVIRVVSEYFRK